MSEFNAELDSRINFEKFESIYLVTQPVDLRKGIDGYASMVQSDFRLDPFRSDSIFLFTNRAKDKMKGINYDGVGFWLLYKRLSKGKFKWQVESEEPVIKITSAQLNLLLEGKSIEPEKGFRKLKPRYI